MTIVDKLNYSTVVALSRNEIDILVTALEQAIDWGDDDDGYVEWIALLNELAEL